MIHCECAGGARARRTRHGTTDDHCRTADLHDDVSGTQEAAPILEKLTSIGYPRDDITILLRPPGTDSAVDLLSHENAAGQDSDATQAIAKLGDKMADACTIVILHPEPGQIEAVRAALTGMGAQEFEYEPQTVYTGAQSEADFARSTVGSVSIPNNAGIEGAGTTSTSGPAGKDEFQRTRPVPPLAGQCHDGCRAGPRATDRGQRRHRAGAGQRQHAPTANSGSSSTAPPTAPSTTGADSNTAAKTETDTQAALPIPAISKPKSATWRIRSIRSGRTGKTRLAKAGTPPCNLILIRRASSA